MTERLVAIIFGSCCLLLVVGAALIVISAVRRRNAGSQVIEERGWQRLPDGSDVTAGWDGWPFMDALEPGTARDIVTGVHRGVQFMTLRWTQREHTSTPGPGGPDPSDTYNIVALRTEVAYPHLTVVRGRHTIRPDRQRPGMSDFDTGDEHFDRRWQTLGDAEFGRAILTHDVRAAMDERDHAWVVQPGWITRVTPWTFYGGEDRAIEELEEMVSPLRSVPLEVWQRYGGAPAFLGGEPRS